MKFTLSPLALSLALLIQPVQADLVSDSEQILDAAQQVYSEFFPSSQPTQTFAPWLYRFYPLTGTYVGINQEDSGVYLLGGTFGSSALYVGQTHEILALLQSQLSLTSSNQNDLCNTTDTPEGITYTQDGSTINISTGGQCIQAPESQSFCETIPETDTSGQLVATGVHALTRNDITTFEVSGINIPTFAGLIEATAQQLAGAETCLINAPTEFINYTINSDVCLDITNQLGDLADFGLSGVTPPVLTRFTGSSVTTEVSDCFATGASTIIDLVTQATWTKDASGTYTQINNF